MNTSQASAQKAQNQIQMIPEQSEMTNFCKRTRAESTTGEEQIKWLQLGECM